MILVPFAYGFAWSYIEYFPQHWVFQQNFKIVGGFTPTIKVLAFVISMIKGAVVMYGLWVLISLFHLYEQGQIFKAANVQCFKSLSRTLFLWVAATIITEPLLTLILTMNNPPGLHAIQFSLKSADVTALVVGGILSVIARVMADAQAIEEEMELTV